MDGIGLIARFPCRIWEIHCFSPFWKRNCEWRTVLEKEWSAFQHVWSIHVDPLISVSFLSSGKYLKGQVTPSRFRTGTSLFRTLPALFTDGRLVRKDPEAVWSLYRSALLQWIILYELSDSIWVSTQLKSWDQLGQKLNLIWNSIIIDQAPLHKETLSNFIKISKVRPNYEWTNFHSYIVAINPSLD